MEFKRLNLTRTHLLSPDTVPPWTHHDVGMLLCNLAWDGTNERSSEKSEQLGFWYCSRVPVCAWPDLEEYSRLAISYSMRKLSYDYDVLNAFSSTTSTLSRTFRDGFLYGLPRIFFEVALLWQHKRFIRPIRRKWPNLFRRGTLSQVGLVLLGKARSIWIIEEVAMITS
jgi:hypothetical protein